MIRAAPLGVALVAASSAACGAGGSPLPPAWVASHPNAGAVAFATSAPGVCALTPRYAGEAPAAITYLGSVFVQVAKKGPSSPPPGATSLATSGDWQVVATSSTMLLLRTRQATYVYREEQSC
ncbi:MAG: hypothetical protein ACYDAC_09380 [Candidatus Dormibacteria bacterium]